MTKLFPNGTPEHVKAFEQVANNKCLSTSKAGTYSKLEVEHPIYKSKNTQLAYDFYMRGLAKGNNGRHMSSIIDHNNDMHDLLSEALNFIEFMTPGLALDIKDSIRAELRSK